MPTEGREGSNLPAGLDPFVGRVAEARQVLEALVGSPLLTLVGPAGIGKTRLAIQVAGRAGTERDDPVWFLDLGRLRSPELVPMALLEGLGLGEQRGRTPIETIATALRDQRALVVLDSCEHLLPELGRSLGSLLRRCRNLKLLATSRVPLGLDQEAVWRVPPLSQADARQLYLERVSRSQPGWAPGPGGEVEIDRLCLRLGRIPLALELAAVHGAQDLPDPLLSPVSGPASDAAEVVAAAAAWSYDGLSEPERALLRRLAAFTGPFDLEAARAICAGPPLDAEAIPALLESLVAQSLLISGPHGFRLPQSLRSFVQAQLVASLEAARTLRRHADHHLALAEAAVLAPTVEDQVAGFERLRREHIDLRAALDWLQLFDRERHLLLVGLMGQFWNVNGHFTEARVRYQAALDLSPAPTRERAEVLQCVAGADFEVGDYGHALDAAAESLRIGRELGDGQVIGDSLAWLGLLLLVTGDRGAAADHLEQSLAQHQSGGSVRGISLARLFRGLSKWVGGDLPGAIEDFEASLAGFSATGAAFYTGQALLALGQVSVLAGRLTRAEEVLRRGAILASRLGSDWSLAMALDALGGAAARRSQPVRALNLAGAADQIRQGLATEMPAAYLPIRAALIAPAEEALSARQARAAITAGRALDRQAATELGLR